MRSYFGVLYQLEPQANEEEFASLVVVQQSRIHRYGSDLTEIAAEPHC
jgi:hypothetical protein